MGCEGDSVYPAFCNGNYDQDTGALVAGTQGECFVAKYDAISGKNEWTAKWKTGDFATAGSVYITSGAIWVAGVANNIDGTSAGGDKAKHPYLVKLGKDGEVYFSRIYPQYTVDSQMGGKNVLGMNTNGGLFMVVGGSVVTVDQGNGDVIKSFILSGARSGSVTAVPASSDYLLLPYSTPAQPRVFDVDGNVIQLRFANGAYNDNIISMMINPANNQQVFVATPGSIALMNLRKSALADNGGNNPTGQTNTNKTTSSVTSISKTTTQTTVALTSTSAAPSTTIAAETTSVAAVPKSTSVASSGFRAAPAGLVSALLAAVAAAFAL